MKVIYGFKKDNLPIKKAVATIGIFDGVHVGHQKIIAKTIFYAHKEGAKSLVITFWPHPLKIIGNKYSSLMLTSLKHRLNLIRNLSPDICLVIKFTRKFSSLSPEEFIFSLVKRINISKIVVGHDFIFGENTQGDINCLKRLGEKYKFSVMVIPEYKISGQPIRSSFVRGLIKGGRLIQAQRCLSRYASVYGKVIKGNKRGRILGYPTANIKTEQEIMPPEGVYLVKIVLNNERRFGICNIGKRPTFGDAKNTILEVHIFNFSKDIYGKDIEVIFLKKIRSEKKFLNRQALIMQIQKDEQTAKKSSLCFPKNLN